MSTEYKECLHCGDDIDPRRWAMGYRTCLHCGEQVSVAERKAWTVVQEYGKGGYMFVTPNAAARTLRETNQKATR